MSRITANYDKICFGIWLRGSRALKSAQEFIGAPSEQAPEQTEGGGPPGGGQVSFVRMSALAVNQLQTELIGRLNRPIRRLLLQHYTGLS